MPSKRFTVRNNDATKNYDKTNIDNRNLIKDYINYLVMADKSPNTIRVYEDILKQMICWLYDYNNDKFFIDLKKRDLMNYFSFLRVTCKVSNKRIGVVKSVLSGFSDKIEMLYEDEYPLFRNIVRNLDVGKTTGKVREPTILTDEIINQMLSKLIELKEYELACYLSLLANSGCRIGELEQLLLSDFDDKNTICNGNIYVTHKIRTKGAGVKGKVVQRYILRKGFKPYLDLWISYRNDNNIVANTLFIKKKTTEYCKNPKCTRMQWYSTRIRKIFNMEFYAHSVRHYFTTKLQKMNMPDNIIKEFLHWESVEMVGVYSDISDEDRMNIYLKDFFTA